MNILPTAQALERINARLNHPISRALFEQSIRPLMVERGDAQQVGATWLFDGQWIGAWAEYLAWREGQIEAGRLPPKSPYSIADMEALFHGHIDPEEAQP